MDIFRNSVLPLTVITISLYGLYKKVPVFTVFTSGAKKALTVTAELLPVLTALTLSVSMFTSSGADKILSELLSPLCSLTGFPPEIVPLCMITPLSGSGSIVVLRDILKKFSPDSRVGKIASVIAGASETTFYASTVYFGSVGITRTRHTIPSGLIADITGFIAASLIIR